LVQVGVGLWGSSWLNVVKESPDWELCALVDLDEEALAQARTACQLPAECCFATVAEAVKATQPCAALVVVPPRFHAQVTLESFDLGLHCLVEKPLTATLTEARAVIEEGKKVGRSVMVSQNYRNKRAAQTVRRLVERGAVGDIGQVYITFQKAPIFSGFRAEMDEPLIVDMAVHHFDLVRGILNLEPSEVRARSYNPAWSYFKGNASALVEFDTPAGAVISYAGSWVTRGRPTTWDGSWDIHGDRGAIEWADNRVVLRPESIYDTVWQPGTRERENILDVDLVTLEAEERHGSLAEFARSLDEKREPETSAGDNIRSLAMVLGAVEAAKTGRSVDLERLRLDGQ
jgi:predicted dehydrogenase